MTNSLCACCRIEPPAGQEHPRSIEIKYGALKGIRRLCEACYIEVSDTIARLVQSRHTFEVSTNAIINVSNRIEERKYRQRLEAIPVPCRPSSDNLL